MNGFPERLENALFFSLVKEKTHMLTERLLTHATFWCLYAFLFSMVSRFFGKKNFPENL